MTEPTQDKRPVLRVITGNPSDEELAVILAIVANVAPEPEEAKGLQAWSDRSRDLLHSPRPSATAWRASVLP
ncbi:MAG: acyl-CoA carboxylase subunit epsilon [Actinomycetes bacterium]